MTVKAEFLSHVFYNSKEGFCIYSVITDQGDAIWYFGLGTDDTYDELFYKAVKSSLEHGFKPDIKREVDEYIQRYMWKYPDKGRNIEYLIGLLSWNW